MHKIVLILLASLFGLQQSCTKGNGQDLRQSDIPVIEAETKPVAKPVVVGAARLEEYLPILTNRKIALMVNQTSTIGQTHLVDTLVSVGVNIAKIFAPEHGFRGDHSAGAHVKNSKDSKTGLPIVSLYGNQKKPSADMLKGVDMVIFDIQDVGVRFYTYISSMHYLMEACAENNIDFMVLDRPNPNGHYIDGPTLKAEYKSFIGMHEVPLVHGMTTGEFAQMINGQGWLNGGLKTKLKVITCLNYNHKTLYELPIRPSPNLPNMASVYLYPSLGLFEGTNVSVGRGTDFPFQVLGRPGQKDTQFEFTPRSIPGVADDPKYANQLCRGIMLKEFGTTYLLTSRQIYLEWLFLFYKSNDNPENGTFFKSFFTKLAGNTDLQKQIESGTSIQDIRATWQPDIVKFTEMRKPYLLYPLG